MTYSNALRYEFLRASMLLNAKGEAEMNRICSGHDLSRRPVSNADIDAIVDTMQTLAIDAGFYTLGEGDRVSSFRLDLTVNEDA